MAACHGHRADGFGCECTRSGSSLLVAVCGELDLASRPTAERATNDFVLTGVASITVDMSALTFLDAAGIGWLVALHRAGVRAGASMVVLVADGGPVARVLELTGVDQVLVVTGQAGHDLLRAGPRLVVADSPGAERTRA